MVSASGPVHWFPSLSQPAPVMAYVPQLYLGDVSPMPGRFSPSAPKFESSRPDELLRYLDEVNWLLDSARIDAPQVRKQMVMRYADDEAYELWGGLQEAGEAFSFERFREEIMFMYLEVLSAEAEEKEFISKAPTEFTLDEAVRDFGLTYRPSLKDVAKHRWKIEVLPDVKTFQPSACLGKISP